MVRAMLSPVVGSSPSGWRRSSSNERPYGARSSICGGFLPEGKLASRLLAIYDVYIYAVHIDVKPLSEEVPVATVHRGLDVATVVKTSLAIADAEGLERLTMRRLASELAVTPMAIYNHVENKEQLLDLVADESLKALPPIDLDAPWDQELKRLFLSLHHLYLDHPTLVQVMAQRPLEGPAALAVAERFLTLLLNAGFDEDDAISAFVSLVNFTIGTSLYRLSRTGAAAGTRPGRFASVTEQAAPTVYRLRQKIADAGLRDEPFIDGLARLIASYASQLKPPAKRARPKRARA